jgi:hypothetical protein
MNHRRGDKNREGVCKSSPGDAVSCDFISVEVFHNDSVVVYNAVCSLRLNNYY